MEAGDQVAVHFPRGGHQLRGGPGGEHAEEPAELTVRERDNSEHLTCQIYKYEDFFILKYCPAKSQRGQC